MVDELYGVYLNGDPETESTRRHMERVLRGEPRRRWPWLIGLLAGAAFLSRAPLALAVPFYALLLAGDRIWEPRRWPWRAWLGLAHAAAGDHEGMARMMTAHRDRRRIR
jgi:hypothetical protein